MGFGSFDDICQKVALPLCAVIGARKTDAFFEKGLLAQCYARPVELANTMIFQLGNAFIHFFGLVVILIIIFNVRAKYTAIGRAEMLHFMYLVIGYIVSTLIVDCGVCPPLSPAYLYFVAVQIGLTSAICISLLYNGLLYFQFWEDGTWKSMCIVRLSSLIWFGTNFIVAVTTFKGVGALTDRETTLLFVMSYVINAVMLFVYVASQLVLVIFALDSAWPLGAIFLGVLFFVVGQVITYVFSTKICNGAKHYVDGLFFASLLNVFTFMMIYKFWDMITSDDLEFSVATVEQNFNYHNLDEKRGSMLFS